ncbi:MAG: DEAD/DEAH box helicase [Promethearchaeota archaeon]
MNFCPFCGNVIVRHHESVCSEFKQFLSNLKIGSLIEFTNNNYHGYGKLLDFNNNFCIIETNVGKCLEVAKNNVKRVIFFNRSADRKPVCVLNNDGNFMAKLNGIASFTKDDDYIYYKIKPLNKNIIIKVCEKDISFNHYQTDDSYLNFGKNGLVVAKLLNFFYYMKSVKYGASANIKMMFFPHQQEVVQKVMLMPYRRAILADEVGLGKTLEAGIIIKEMQYLGLAKKIIIVTPASILKQWKGEMIDRFFLELDDISKWDPEDFKAHLKNNKNNEIRLIATHQKLYRDEYLAVLKDPDYSVSWDIAIIDEAHHIHHTGKESYYKLAKTLSERSKTFLLLTATPIQLNVSEFAILIDVLNYPIFKKGNKDHFKDYHENIYPKINEFISKNPQFYRENEAAKECLFEFLENLKTQYPYLTFISEHYREIFDIQEELINSDEIYEALQQLKCFNIYQVFLARHSKKEVFPEKVDRDVSPIRVKMDPDEEEIYNEIDSYLISGSYDKTISFSTFRSMLASSKAAFKKSIYKSLEKASFDTTYIKKKIDSYLKEFRDRKVDELIKLIREFSDEKHIIVFFNFKETIRFVEKELSNEFPEKRTYIFWSELNKTDRSEVISDFEDYGGILLCTDAAAEGKNLQFCHILINYDLPWNPMKVEQRIGRIDRIGQDKVPIIKNLFLKNTIEDRVLQRLLKRIGLYEGTIGTLEPIITTSIKKLSEEVIISDSESQIKEKIDEIIEIYKERKEKSKEFFKNISIDKKIMDVDKKKYKNLILKNKNELRSIIKYICSQIPSESFYEKEDECVEINGAKGSFDINFLENKKSNYQYFCIENDEIKKIINNFLYNKCVRTKRIKGIEAIKDGIRFFGIFKIKEDAPLKPGTFFIYLAEVKSMVSHATHYYVSKQYVYENGCHSDYSNTIFDEKYEIGDLMNMLEEIRGNICEIKEFKDAKNIANFHVLKEIRKIIKERIRKQQLILEEQKERRIAFLKLEIEEHEDKIKKLKEILKILTQEDIIRMRKQEIKKNQNKIRELRLQIHNLKNKGIEISHLVNVNITLVCVLHFRK